MRWRLLPWWARVALIFVAARAVTTWFVLWFAAMQAPNAWTEANPGYFAFANLWDARWFEIIAFQGYPTELPLDAAGQVGENAWAFLPVYPLVVRFVMLFGFGWDVASVVVSFAAGLGAALVLHRLMSRFLAGDQATFAVVLFSVAPVAPILQFGYAEALGYLWIALALLLLVDRRYEWLFPIVLVWSFTRPGAVAFALTLGLHWIVRFVRRERDPFPMRARVLVASAALFTAIAGLAWPVIAGVATDHPMAYTDTELAWRAVYIGHHDLLPFTPWFQGGDWWLGQPWGTIAVVALISTGALVLFSPWVRRLGIDVRLWLGSYGLYLLAVFFPQSSTFRIASPLFPIVGALAVPRARWYRWAIVIVFLALQFAWLSICWRINGADWTPP